MTHKTCSAALDGFGSVDMMALELGNCLVRELRASVAVDVEAAALFRWRRRIELDTGSRGRTAVRTGENACPCIVVSGEPE